MPRWVIAVLGAVLIVTLFVVFRPGGAEEAAPPPITTSPTAGGPTPTDVTPEPTETAEPTPTATGTLDAVEIEVEEGRVEGPARIRVSQGDRVAIEVESDVAEEVHVHGYDLFFDVAPERRVRITFVADLTGVFEIELEESGVLLTRLEVTP